ncbi:hypothetical protein ARMSODRAFT_975545 [Armillaria solidipes]|uniref:Uncharacterized protein n=1 Tax=Armillaria solidipes TaxID=1076256 RepID=A0A2H3BI76_9AGAR|nr:hypothetical protein ARMSODRAFT_975545 [Armillaria solidipes]
MSCSAPVTSHFRFDTSVHQRQLLPLDYSQDVSEHEGIIMVITCTLFKAQRTLRSLRSYSFVREKMRPGASKATVPAKTDDAHDESMTEYDSSVDARRPESALYPDDQDPFASMTMVDVHLRYI